MTDSVATGASIDKARTVARRGRSSAGTLVAAIVLAFAIATPAFAVGPSSRGEGRNANAEPQPPKGFEPGPPRHGRPQPPADTEPGPPGAGEKITVPSALNLYRADGFRYQDTNYSACTAASAMDMLNFIRLGGTGGPGFRWTTSRTAARRDAILAWERTHDTLAGGQGSDPHGWRTALNWYGWGSAALSGTARVYEDYAYSSYARAVKAAVRSMIRYRKPVGIAAWRGRHAQMLTGYDGLRGDPFARNAAGAYTNTFTVSALYLSDPLQASAVVNRRIAYSTLGSTTNTRIRFQPYYETDSPYDDPYTGGWVRARDEWYGRWVIVAARR